MKKVLSIMLVCAVICCLFSLTVHAENAKITKPLQNILDKVDPEDMTAVMVWLNYGDITKPEFSFEDYLNSTDNADASKDERQYRHTAAQRDKEFYVENNERIISELCEFADFEVTFVSAASPLIELNIKAKDIEKLTVSDSVSEIFLDRLPEADPYLEKIDSELALIMDTEPERFVSVAVERKAVVPLSVEDMPSYRVGDQEARNKARRELADINKSLNNEFIKELADYADFELKLNTNTTYVVLDVKAQDAYSLAICSSVFEISFMSDLKWYCTAGTEKLLGDADSDSLVTVLDATRIQRYKADLVDTGSIDLTAADYDEDGDVTILDATRIQRSLAEL